jgi:hypothetical protein
VPALKKTGLSNESVEYQLQESSRIHVQERRRLIELLAKFPVIISFTHLWIVQDLQTAGSVA